MEKPTKEGESPVCKNDLSSVRHLSTAGHANPAGS